VDHSLQLIGEHPEAWSVIETNIRRFVLQDFPYAIFYVVEDATLRVVAIAHTIRRPGYWHDRI
jgi:plasmid stabilization system protein ParE